jgi:carbonic anhydrase/acetyltransferase-like protein (isoleucine patch superfamily)
MEDFDHGLPENQYNKHAWIAGDVEIGENVWIGAFTLIDGIYASLKIGRGTNISSGAQILTHSTVRRCISEKRWGDVDSAPTEVGEFCFIGTNAVILKGVKIGHHSVVAAGAVVPENTVIPAYSIVAGIPAKVVGSSKKFLKGIEGESISICIPAFNEEKNLKDVVKETISAVSKIVKDYEIILVNDGSSDKTGKIIDRLARKNKKIKVFHHKKNKGFTGAMKTALYSATKHLVFLAPADGQFDFNELIKFTEAIKGYDVAIGYRVNKYKSLVRRIYTSGFHFLAKSLLNIPFREFSTVFMWRRRVIELITVEADSRSAMFLPEFFAKAVKTKFKFVEVPVHWRERGGGVTKVSGLKALVVIFKTFFGILKLKLVN